MIIEGIYLKVLILEDSERDYDLIREQITDAGFELDAVRAETEKDFTTALRENRYDIILSDFRLPGFDAFQALKIRNEICPEVPFICVSGSIGEETAIELLKLGAVDYVLKDKPDRLPFTIKRALDEAKEVEIRKQAEQSLKESEEKYRRIAENVSDVLWIVDLEMNTIYVSPSVEKVTGFSVEEYLNSPITEKHPSSSIKKINTVFQEEMLIEQSPDRDLKRSRYIEVEHYLHGKSATIWLGMTVAAIRDKDGHMVSIQGVSRDITERKMAEEQSRELASFQRLLIILATQFVNISLDELDRAVNKLLQVTGDFGGYDRVYIFDYDTERQTASNTYEWSAEGVTSEIDNLQEVPFEYFPDATAVLDKGEPFLVQNVAELPEDSFMRQHFQSQSIQSLILVPMMKEGITVGFIGFDSVKSERFFSEKEIDLMKVLAELVTNIFEKQKSERALRESERKFSSLISNLPGVAYRCKNDEGWTRVFVSEGCYELTGYKPEEIINNREVSFIDLSTEEEAIRLRKKWDIALNERRVFSEEYRITAKDGTKKWVWEQGHGVYSDTGEVLALEGIITDITSRKQIEKDREELEARLLQAQKMDAIGRLAGGIAHDFNNILSIIYGYTESALNLIENEHPAHHSIEKIFQAAERSSQLTRQLLTFARKQVFTPQFLDLNDTVNQMITLLRRLVGENIDIKWEPSRDLWGVFIDPAQIDQLLANLCINARDAIEEIGTIIISVNNETVSHSQQGDTKADGIFQGDFALLKVSDSGCGMDEEIQSQIFDPFFTTKKIGEGTGLGLSTVYGIVKQNKGHIEVESEPGKGATFRIYLPRHEQIGELQEEMMEPQKETNREGSETILLVEDDVSLLELLKGMIANYGYEVIPAQTPSEAIHIYKQRHDSLSLVVSDVMMPEMNGVELKKELQKINSDLKILYMSGYGTDILSRKNSEESSVFFIAKPFSGKKLAEKIREVIEEE